MKKRIAVLTLVAALLALTVVPALAFSGIEFTVRDGETGQPWGTYAGQEYRIFVTSGGSTLLDTGQIASPPLNFVCAYDNSSAECPGTWSAAPTAGSEVTIYILLYGSSDNPETIIRSFTQPPVDLGNYIVNDQTDTGPTAVTMQNIGADSSSTLPLLAGMGALLLLGLSAAALRRRQDIA